MRVSAKKLLTAISTAAFMVVLSAGFAACSASSGNTETAAATTTPVTEAKVPSETVAETVAETAAETVTETENTPEIQEPTYDPDFRVTGYIVGGISDLSTFNTDHLAKLTDIILIGDGMPHFNNQGEIELDPNFALYVANIREATRGLPVRIHVSLVGPGAVDLPENATWDTMMHNVARQYRKAFKSGQLESNIKNLLETYGLDGAFFDWEYPAQSIHKTWFGEFLVSLDAVLGDEYVIGCAISHWCADFPADAIAVIDMVELMSYDLFDSEGYHATTALAKEHVNTLLNLGYKPEQIDLGIPFYGHPITGEMSWYGYNSFYDKLDENGLFHEENSGLKHHFNTPAVVYEKTAWCIENGIGGVMAWHYSCDAPADSGYSLFSAIAQAKEDAGAK